MGIATRNALDVVIAASVLLAVSSVLTWGYVWIHADFAGPIKIRGIHGTEMANIVSLGDGTILLLGALATIALAACALRFPASGVAAGRAIAVGGFAMSAIALYDILHPGGVDLSEFYGVLPPADPWIRMTVIPYLAAADAFFIGITGTFTARSAQNPQAQPEGLTTWA